VLAGGLSRRMGRDKALLELNGRPLAALAVEKLMSICESVYVLSSRLELADFAPLVPDIHLDCGPIGGIEAALLHAPTEWTLIIPVDVPFVPGDFLGKWAAEIIAAPFSRVALFTVDAVPQPTLCLLHSDVLQFVQQAIKEGAYKLFPVLEGAARDLALNANVAMEQVLLNSVSLESTWFANVNTPEEFVEAEHLAHRDASYRDRPAEKRRIRGHERTGPTPTVAG
jgi:molybdopterin-guanine dinucleotide biosynthesis protein A